MHLYVMCKGVKNKIIFFGFVVKDFSMLQWIHAARRSCASAKNCLWFDTIHANAIMFPQAIVLLQASMAAPQQPARASSAAGPTTSTGFLYIGPNSQHGLSFLLTQQPAQNLVPVVLCTYFAGSVQSRDWHLCGTGLCVVHQWLCPSLVWYDAGASHKSHLCDTGLCASHQCLPVLLDVYVTGSLHFSQRGSMGSPMCMPPPLDHDFTRCSLNAIRCWPTSVFGSIGSQTEGPPGRRSGYLSLRIQRFDGMRKRQTKTSRSTW